MRGVVFAFLMAFAAPALAAAAEPGPVRSMLEMRQQRVITQGWDLSCGAAVLATVLVHELGDAVTEREVAIGLMSRPEYLARPEIVRIREGFSLLDMQRYVETRGHKGEGLGKLTFEDLQAMAPVIVPVTRHGYNHFVIFRGALNDRVLIADPSFGTRTLRRDQFERMWRPHPRLGRIGFTVTRSDGRPAPRGLAPRPDEFLTFT